MQTFAKAGLISSPLRYSHPSSCEIEVRTELEQRLRQREETWEWAEIIRGLDNLHEVEATFQGHRFFLRSQLVAQAHKAIRAGGVAVPATIRER